MLDRRSILKTALAAGAMSVWDAPIRFAFATVPTDRRLVVVILRGALDGLAAAPPHGDPDYKSVRGALALDTTGTNALHDLDGHFGLHPALTNMKAMWDAKELVVFQNISSPYRDRSHFDGQNVLETGATGPHVLGDGWLNRALKPMGLADGEGALAVAASPPLLLSGTAKASSWMPAVMPQPDAAFLKRVGALYGNDPVLRASLASAIDTEAKADAAMDDKPKTPEQMAQRAGSYGDLTPLFAGAGRLLARDDGPRVAVLDASGWDTHVNEGAGDGQLARRLRALDAALDAMKTALGPAWNKTAVVMATEFGRTAAPNGNGGTDHGTAGAAFLLGGAVKGGTVQAQWTGLKPAALKDGRDQPPQTDMRVLFKGVLSDHMRVARRDLDATVFPDSGSASPAAGLFAA
ncbi:MAG TPA: DUF1501 domain-containing protein [Rhizomicrobium sp.]|nr:DUF1501 domain-containing protein [Rhizomicrobium sp.]